VEQVIDVAQPQRRFAVVALQDVLACRSAGDGAGEHQDAPVAEIEVAARRAVEQVASEFEAHRAAEADKNLREQLIEWSWVPGADLEETRRAVREALAKLPPGTPRKKLEEARDAALAAFKAAVAQREDAERRRKEEKRKLAAVEFRLSFRLPRVSDYLRQLEQWSDIEFDSYTDRRQTAEKLEQKIRPILLRELVEKPEMSDKKIHRRIEKLVDAHLDAVIEQ